MIFPQRSFAVTLVCVLCAVSVPSTFPFSVPTHSFGYMNEKVTLAQFTPQPEPTRASFTAAPDTKESILFVGDVLLARNVEYLMEREGCAYPFAGVAFEAVAKNSYVVGNFEAAVPEVHVTTPVNNIRFSVDTKCLPALAAAGMTHLSLSNNHSFDYGAVGYRNTQAALEEAGVTPFGHPQRWYEAEMPILTVGEQRVALLALHTLDSRPAPAELHAWLRTASAKSDVQVVYVHWGVEYDTVHSTAQEELAKQLVAAGADLIVGHHPHVVQDIGLINGVPVFYSLGNYIFDQYFSDEVMTGLLLELSFAGGEGRIHLLPVSSQEFDSQPRFMSARAHQWFLRTLAEASAPELRSAIYRGVVPLYSEVATSSKIAMMNK